MQSASDAMKKIEEAVRAVPARARWYAAAFFCLVLILYATVVYPASARLKRLQGELNAIQRQMEIQTKLLPMYAKFNSLIQNGIPDGLPQTQGTSIKRNEVQSVPSLLKAVAQTNGVILVSIIPQPNLKSGVANFMPVDIVAKGSFSRFREFLLSASVIPGFDSISHMEIMREAGGEKLEARMWIVVE